MERFLEEVFEKAQKESGNESLRGRCEYLSEHILEDFKFQLSYKTLERYYKGESNPKGKVRDLLARYLEYDSFKDYRTQKEEKQAKKKEMEQGWKISGRWLLIGLIPIVSGAGYFGYVSSKGDCMIWKEDHYERTSCTGGAGEEVLKEYKLAHFRQIEVSDTTRFFKHGKVQVWYDKTDHVLTYFSAPGINPETGKTVKPITEYMINKYLRPNR